MRKTYRFICHCDFCKFTSHSEDEMVKHEYSCKSNPNRVCMLCGFEWSDLYVKAVVKEVKCNEFFLLGILTADCPDCIKSAILQSKVAANIAFDYKKRLKEWGNE